MLFNSLGFLFGFLPVCLLGYHVASRYGHRLRLLWLAAASLFFYAMWNLRFLSLLLFSVLLNYGLSRWIARERGKTRGRVLTLGVLLNLALLFYYKYLFVLLVWLASEAPRIHVQLGQPHPILLPLGISFFTFTQISYLIDLAQGQAEAQDFLRYLLFVTFFPHLIAGPLLHHREIMHQFESGPDLRAPVRGLCAADLNLGFTWFVLGLAKKVLIADKLAPVADAAFANAGSDGVLGVCGGLLVYCMQLYFDFSGYSDMAIGLANMFGIRFPMNFNSPWKATSVTEYWQRWHMTLTRYITLYLYNPLLLRVQRARIARGKKVSRKSLSSLEGFASMVAYPTMTAMLLTGIWHGAGLQFLVFGGIHGVYLTANQAWRHLRGASAAQAGSTPVERRISTILAMRFGVLVQVAVALIFFRASSFGAAVAMLRALLGQQGLGHIVSPLQVGFATALLVACWLLPNTQELLGQQVSDDAVRTPWSLGLVWRANTAWALLTACLFFAALVNLDEASSFLYFQF